MDWKSVQIPSGCKVFRVQTFMVMISGKTFSLEIDEYSDGSFTGHGEQTNDDSTVLASVTAKSAEECLNQLISSIKDRG